MSGLAHALCDRGFTVSGSDRSQSARTDELAAAGVTIHVGHAAQNVAGATVVVYTTAIAQSNPELVAAREAGAQIVHRAEVLAFMTVGRRSIAITGTHGKSSTTAMIATIFTELERDPSVFVGADSPNIGGNYRLGKGEDVIFEACESDGSFLRYEGCSEVLLNLEAEHLDQHRNLERLRQLFQDFVKIADPQGFLVWCHDCPELPSVVEHAPCRTVSYGLSEGADITAREVVLEPGSISFVPVYRGEVGARVTLNVPGAHNVRNALAALGAAVESGIPLDVAGAALGKYASIGRRFDILGEVNGRLIVDDYAHHPTEVAATLAAARAYEGRRIVAVFQPHLYSRTRYFRDEFARALAAADVVILNEIYAAREEPIPGVSAENIAEVIRRDHPGTEATYMPSQEDIVAHLRETSRPGDMILIMGAGDIRHVAEALAASDLS